MALSDPTAAAQDRAITTPGGQLLRTAVDRPPDAPLAALVLAPGAAYGLHRPSMAALAAACSARGIAVWRFDWSVTAAAPAGRPSASLIDELGELQAVLAEVRRTLGTAVPCFVAGKSVGSVVAWRAFRADASLRGVLLLTPLCRTQAEADAHYPGLVDERRPVALVAGDADLQAPASVLGPWLADARATLKSAVFPGDHGFEVGRQAEVHAPAAWAAGFVAGHAAA